MYTSPSGKSYIGQTWNESARKRNHKRADNDYVFSKAIKKYGYENFRYEVIHSGIETQEEMNRLECLEIENRKSLIPNGYNQKEGGRNSRMPEDVKKKISMANKGYKHTEEAKAKMSKSKTGKTIKRTAPSSRKKPYHTEESKRKISQAQKDFNKNGGIHSKETMVICEETGRIFLRVKDAAEFYGCLYNQISAVISKKRKTFRGLHFSYLDPGKGWPKVEKV